jgi:hypothetical protein
MLNNGQSVQTLLCCFPWLPSYGYLVLPIATYGCLVLPIATFSCLVLPATAYQRRPHSLYISWPSLSCWADNSSINPFIHSMSPFFTYIPLDSAWVTTIQELCIIIGCTYRSHKYTLMWLPTRPWRLTLLLDRRLSMPTTTWNFVHPLDHELSKDHVAFIDSWVSAAPNLLMYRLASLFKNQLIDTCFRSLDHVSVA